MIDIREHGGSYGGNSTINGIINQYQVATGQNISVGDFVTCVNDRIATDSQQIGSNLVVNSKVCATQLDNERVFVTYLTSTFQVYGVVCKISDTAIQTGTPTLITDIPMYSIFAFTYSTDKVIVSCSENSNQIFAILCTIDGLSISISNTQSLITNISNFRNVNFAFVSYNSCLICFHYGLTLFGIVFTCNGSSFTVGQPTQIGGYTDSGNFSISICKIADNKMALFYDVGSNVNLYGSICTISGTTITKGGVETRLDNNPNSGYYLKSVSIFDNLVLVVYPPRDAETNVMAVNVSGTTLSLLKVNAISNENGSVVNSKIIKTSNYTALIVFGLSNSSGDALYGTEISYDLDNGKFNILLANSLLSNIPGSGFLNNLLLFGVGDVAIIHSNAYKYLYFKSYHFAKDRIKAITSSSEIILGISKENKSQREKIKIYTPNY